MKNLYKDLDTETLNWMSYKFEHCDGQCINCPCHDISFYCGYVNEQVKKELQKRGE